MMNSCVLASRFGKHECSRRLIQENSNDSTSLCRSAVDAVESGSEWQSEFPPILNRTEIFHDWKFQL